MITAGISYRRRKKRARQMTPDRVLVCVNTNHADSPAIADYYMQVRGVPTKNRLDYPVVFSATEWVSRWDENSLMGFLDVLSVKLTELPKTEAVVLCGWWPTRIRIASIVNEDYPFDTTMRFPVFMQEMIKNGQPFHSHFLTNAIPSTNRPEGLEASSFEARNFCMWTPPCFLGYRHNAPLSSYSTPEQLVAELEEKTYSLNNTLSLRKYESSTPSYYLDVSNAKHVFVSSNSVPQTRRPLNGWTISENIYTPIGVAYEPAPSDCSLFTPLTCPPTFSDYAKVPHLYRHVLYYRLSAPPPAPADPVWGGKSVFDVVKRNIDAMLAAEQQGWTTIPGDVVVFRGGYDVGQASTYFCAKQGSAPNVWVSSGIKSGLSLRIDGNTSYTLSSNLPPGCGEVIPVKGKAWAKPSPIFSMLLSNGAYFNIYKDTSFNYPYDYGHYDFIDGSVHAASQSCGAQNVDFFGLDFYYDTVSIPKAKNTQGRMDVYNAVNSSIAFAAPQSLAGYVRLPFQFKYSGTTATTAEVEATADNQFTLYEDGTAVAVLDLPSTSIKDALDYVAANLPSTDWEIRLGCPGVRSRAADYLLRAPGANVWGAVQEPYVTNNPAMHYELFHLYDGWTMHDARLAYTQADGAQCDINHAYIAFFGDPLYRPFWKNWK